MHVLFGVVLLVAFAETHAADTVHGVVYRHDGSRAAGAVVALTCATWRRQTTTDADGRFSIEAAPPVDCVLRVQAVDDPGAGLTVHVPADSSRLETLSAILPAGVGVTPHTSDVSDLPIQLTSDADAAGRVSLTGRRPTVRGAGAWSGGQGAAQQLYAAVPGLAHGAPGVRPDQWTTGVTASRAGPWGTLFTGSASARRVTGPNTLLSDVTGVQPPGSGAWSPLFNAARAPVVWDTRVRVERTFSTGRTDLTVFGEAYQSFISAPADGSVTPALPPSATRGLFSGSTGRVGLTIRF